MSGHLSVVGLGPGSPEQVTPQVRAALDLAQEIFGYSPYLARVPEKPGQTRHATDNREELSRAGAALERAAAGARVVMVSGGDPG
ncbi:MAG TPA: SAM-dependent methyltransferase, partial [Xanthobacteraceae bacterium]|nr:SAM-dependent methyltransferase [Xanthobacteraceae bacterium]